MLGGFILAAWIANKIRLVIEEVDKQSAHYRNARRDGRL